MPLLAPREGDSDGGYAVRDYRAVDPRFGAMDDLERLCGLARHRGVSVCVDLVLNHCAAEHPWALAARAGDPEHEAMFWVVPDRELPDAFERTLPEVFPTSRRATSPSCPRAASGCGPPSTAFSGI